MDDKHKETPEEMENITQNAPDEPENELIEQPNEPLKPEQEPSDTTQNQEPTNNESSENEAEEEIKLPDDEATPEYDSRIVAEMEKNSYNKANQFRKYFANLKSYLVIFGFMAFGTFVYNVYTKFQENKDKANLAYVKEKDFDLNAMNVDNFSLYSAAIDGRIEDLNKQQEEQGKSIDRIEKNLETLGKSQVDLLDSVRNNNKKIEELITSNNDLLKKQIGETKDDAFSRIKKLGDELSSKFNAVKTETEARLAEAERKRANMVGSGGSGAPRGKGEEEIMGDEEGESYNLLRTNIKVKRVSIKTMEEPQLEIEEQPQAAPRFIEISNSISKGVLLTSGDATVTGFGTQKDMPIMISLTDKILLANEHTLDARKCLVLGSGAGNITTESVEIRLVKLTCIFVDQDGSQWIAKGPIKGFVTDENGQNSVRGELVSREGKLFKSIMPLAFIQTGLEYVTRSASQATILGTGIAGGGLATSLNSGISSAGNTALTPIVTLYSQYARAMQPVVNIKAGREVGVVFYGDELIQIVPYNDHNVGDGFIDMSNKVASNGRSRADIGLYDDKPMVDNNFDYLVPKVKYEEGDDE